jgi:hypothetical protein
MAVLDDLPPDQRAALQLLLKQGQSYEQLAGLLNIDAQAVRRRAHEGVERLGAGAPDGVTDESRGDIADYLLGQQTVSQREATRSQLLESDAARAWANAVAAALRELAPESVPEVPGGAAAAAAPSADADAGEPAPALLEDEPATRVREPRAPRQRRPRPRGPGVGKPQLPSSRLGGALLLAGAAIVVAVVIVLLVSGGGNDKASTLSTNPSTTSTNANPNQPVAQVNLFSPSGRTSTVGLAQVFRNGSRLAVVIAAQGLPQGTYALWLYNSASDFRLLGFVPKRVGKDGRFATQGALPADANKFKRLVVTQEQVTSQTSKPPAKPGTIVLQGDLKLG